ncbi:hypothetical protein [Hymenobacter properus]|uniref:Uncharacterized protein n=1 Tax=Hymenobacter properus TaxID=2791026 RepID=A0A931BEK1_9BACT|nr:hypothetical protein [Hymenobacter properus]MBF9140852.1 hypothetical protein [Hymenobacter properus]MBR7719661.1 hypothetical protein [Microvirga sp. SRT04]
MIKYSELLVPLTWIGTLHALREGWQLKPLNIQIESVKTPDWQASKYGPPRYAPRVAAWIIRMLDATPRLAPDHPNALKVTLHQPGYTPCVYGYFDACHAYGRGLLTGLYAHHCKLSREAKREAKRQRELNAAVWVVASLAGVELQQTRRHPGRRHN